LDFANHPYLCKGLKEMFGNVWDWAGEIRTAELNFGINAYLVSTELKKLTDDLSFWHENKTFNTIEISARLHYRAVVIHPFLNGNGRWSRMLANIYLKQNELKPNVLFSCQKLKSSISFLSSVLTR
jgi:fido (protein-threonine AMPylation protein)